MRFPAFVFALVGLALLTAKSASADEHLAGVTVDYQYDAKDLHKRERAWWGRTYLHPSVLGDPDVPRPIVIYLHGINKHFVRYPWMGADGSPDLRAVWDAYMREGRIAPAVLAAPSTTVSCKLPQALWDGFDLDRFLAHTIQATRDRVRIDLSQVIVIGHSGAGCNHRGGLVTALQSTLPLRGGLVIDVCMEELDASPLARARPGTDVVVTYQRRWQRDFQSFTTRFLDASKTNGATGLRQVEELTILDRNPHTVIVQQSMDKWLPRWLPPSWPSRDSGSGVAANRDADNR